MSRASAHIRQQPRRVARARAHALLSDIAIGVLSFLVLVCVGLATPALWTVMVESTAPKPRACDMIKDPAERALCNAAHPPHTGTP